MISIANINGQVAASALEVAYRIYSDVHPLTNASLHLGAGPKEGGEQIDARVTAVATMAVTLLRRFYRALPEGTTISDAATNPAEIPG